MGALGYRNAIVEFQPTTPLEEVDEKVSSIHVALIELSTTHLVLRFAVKDDD